MVPPPLPESFPVTVPQPAISPAAKSASNSFRSCNLLSPLIRVLDRSDGAVWSPIRKSRQHSGACESRRRDRESNQCGQRRGPFSRFGPRITRSANLGEMDRFGKANWLPSFAGARELFFLQDEQAWRVKFKLSDDISVRGQLPRSLLFEVKEI